MRLVPNSYKVGRSMRRTTCVIRVGSDSRKSTVETSYFKCQMSRVDWRGSLLLKKPLRRTLDGAARAQPLDNKTTRTRGHRSVHYVLS